MYLTLTQKSWRWVNFYEIYEIKKGHQNRQANISLLDPSDIETEPYTQRDLSNKINIEIGLSIQKLSSSYIAEKWIYKRISFPISLEGS